MSRPPARLADPAADVLERTEATRGEAARRALRHIASGVTVLTVSRDGVPHGTTASAVVAVSRDPLIVGVCLHESSSFGAMVRRSGTFSVNVLTSGQTAVARHFADPQRPLGHAQFAQLEWSTDTTSGAPLISGSLAHLSCRVVNRYRVGDHEMVLAEVTGGTHATGSPMLSFAGRLHEGAVTPSPRSVTPSATRSEVS
ncbi:flavin reductase family protein [Streptomyces sp. TP-A0356]|uniref:flavin reductase family protein n=1 Tax=Streptomyces sp. TP-A0356 TaxID=1359208 RepID=UPI000AA18B38|nr:flavin reductase family protein [Streptomyces sp. TP-A0356]